MNFDEINNESISAKTKTELFITPINSNKKLEGIMSF